MTSHHPATESNRILGTLHIADGKGVVRIEDRYATGVEDLWSALTDPRRLAGWYAEVEGDLRVGGEFRKRVFASGWDGTGRVVACEPPRRLLVTSKEEGEDELATEVTLTADGDHTIVVIEERGMPAKLLAAYGAGVQIHAEDLAAHIAGRGRCDAAARWNELEPAYTALAAELD